MVTNLLKRVLWSIIGVVVMLAYWSFTGDDSSTSEEGIPARVWEGNAATLTVDVETTSPARFSVSFNERAEEDGRSMETWTRVPPGKKSWSIQVPPKVGGYVELGAENPKVGDHLTWKIMVDYKIVDEQSETLEEELREGYAFFLQSYFEDYSTGEFGTD